MQELMLVENPYSRKSHGRNPVYVAPYAYKKGRKAIYVPGYVKRGVRKMKNPISVGAIQREWLGGMDVMDMGAALGGLAASTMLPSAFIKDTNTTGRKVLKVLAGFASAALAGFVFRNVSPAAGKFAIAGGVAGALAQAVNMYKPGAIGNPTRFISAPVGAGLRGSYNEPVAERTNIITNIT